MKNPILLLALIAALASQDLYAWGAEGHRLIGRAAFELLDDKARAEVLSILGHPERGELAEAVDHACNWPDFIREQPEWTWTSPLHYVNIPRHTDAYDRSRDCPSGRCVTEAILDFSNRLGYPDLEPEKRWQAFSFVCHFVGDLHQPLHAGFRDDRGGNTVEITYSGKEYNLHQFWDGVLVRQRMEDEDRVVSRLVEAGRTDSARDWAVDSVAAWTDESHAIAAKQAYPDGRYIGPEFADQAWTITMERWERAAGRMAQVLNAVLGENEVLP